MTDENRSMSAYRQSLKEKVLFTAMHAFASYGIRAVKMDDIAQALSISKRTLYEIYDNKEVLLFEAIRLLKAQHDHEMADVVEKSGNVMDVLLYVTKRKIEDLRLTNPLFYSDMSRYPRVMAFLEEGRRQNRHLVIDFFRRGVDEGFFRSDVDYDLLLTILESTINHIMSSQLYINYPIEQLFRHAVLVCFRGICTPLGVEAIDRSDV